MHEFNDDFYRVAIEGRRREAMEFIRNERLVKLRHRRKPAAGNAHHRPGLRVQVKFGDVRRIMRLFHWVFQCVFGGREVSNAAE